MSSNDSLPDTRGPRHHHQKPLRLSHQRRTEQRDIWTGASTLSPRSQVSSCLLVPKLHLGTRRCVAKLHFAPILTPQRHWFTCKRASAPGNEMGIVGLENAVTATPGGD